MESGNWVTLARLLRPQGRKGELLAELLTDFPERFTDRTHLHLRRADGELQPVHVEGYWLPVGRNAGRVVLKLEGIDSINAAETLSGFEIVVPHDQRMPLGEDEQYVDDLVGCILMDADRLVGTVEDVHFPTSASGNRLEAAAPLLVVRSPQGDEILIPFAKLWIRLIDMPGKRIEMQLPEGLVELNG